MNERLRRTGFLLAVLTGGLTGNVLSAGAETYDREAEQGTVPLNLVPSKTIKIDKTPWRFGLEANYYVERPDLFGPKWMIGFNITPVVPNVFAQWMGLKK